MLWIGSGRDSAITEEVARHTGLEASFALSDSQDWKKKDVGRRRVIVLELPASSAFVQEVLATAQKATRPLPVVILDRDRSLNEMLIGPASGLFQHLVGERSLTKSAPAYPPHWTQPTKRDPSKRSSLGTDCWSARASRCGNCGRSFAWLGRANRRS